MGYADYEFYKNEYYGTAIAENDFPKWSDRASRQIDVLTFRRLLTAYPEDEYTDKQIKLCVCDLAQKMMEIDKYNQSSALDDSGKPKLIKSVSAGSESYTYVTTESKYAELSKDDNKRKQYFKSIVNEYLAYLSDANGVNLLYAGGVKMFQDTVTLFNFYEDKKKGTAKWYPTVLENVELQISRGVTVTKDGNSNDNNATLHIRQIEDYVPPIAYKSLEDKAGVFTLKPEDFFVEGPVTDIVIDENDYQNGFFEYAKANYDNVFQITTIERFKAIPHFEVGGK